MMEQSQEVYAVKRKIGLVFQGGGALGAYEAGAYRALREEGIEPDIISGVSIGAINASAIVGSENPLVTLERLWEDFTLPYSQYIPRGVPNWWGVLGHPRFYQPRFDYLRWPRWTYFYKTTKLRKTLLRHIDFARINQSRTKMIISAINVKTGELEDFTNFRRKTPLTVDHVLASSSLPPVFPWTVIDHQYYWDGGLLNNTPLRSVIDHLGEQASEATIFVVGLFPHRHTKLPTNLLEVYDRMAQIRYSQVISDDIKRVRLINRYLHIIHQLEEENRVLRLQLKEAGMEPAAKEKSYRLPDHKKIDIISVTLNRSEGLTGFADFSKRAIEERMALGYKDMKEHLKNATL
jgi:NTE family protein